MSESERVAVQRFKTQLLEDLASDLRSAVRAGSLGDQQAVAVESAARQRFGSVTHAPDLKSALNELRGRWPSLEILDKFFAKNILSLAALEFVAENESEFLSDIRAINERARRESAALPMDHVFSRERLGLHHLQGVFESALLKPSLNDAGKLRLEDGQHGCWVSLLEKAITFGAWYQLRESVSPEVRLKYANLINVRNRGVKASIDDDGDLALEWTVNTDGGVTKHNIAATGKLFLAAMGSSLSFVEDILAK